MGDNPKFFFWSNDEHIEKGFAVQHGQGDGVGTQRLFIEECAGRIHGNDWIQGVGEIHEIFLILTYPMFLFSRGREWNFSQKQVVKEM